MRIFKKILIALVVLIVALAIAGYFVLRGDPATLPFDDVTGTDPTLAEPDPQTIPTVKIAKPVGWKAGEMPEAAQGLQVTRFAEGLEHPRVIYTLPNGDVLVALSNAPARIVAGGGITNFVAGILFSQAGAATPSPNKLVLLRDADGDGVAELKQELRGDLDSPSGMAFHDGKLYVANHDEVVAFDYQLGATQLTGTPTKLMDLPAAGNHWMRNISLKPDGTKLY
ncbi:MAG: sorbosone dehydrogenase family protein, partial [Proteobacteria bacterium]